MFPRILASGLAIALAAPVAAQQATPPAAATTQPPDSTALKSQMRAFEVLLKGAVETAGQKLANWAGPTVTLAPAADPTVVSTLSPDESYHFIVQIPEIMPISIALYETQRRPIQPLPPGPSAENTRVSSTTVPKDDPMAAPPSAGGPTARPDAQYSDYVREGLYDAILDSSGMLPFQSGQWLTVTAIAVDVAVTNSLYRNPSRKLILSIKGEDLLALRQRTITRDQAKDRIVERRF